MPSMCCFYVPITPLVRSWRKPSWTRVGIGKFKGYSAGSMPRGKIHPMALELLNRLNYDTSNARSKSWDEFTRPGIPELDFVYRRSATTPQTRISPIRPGSADERALGAA